MLIFEGGHGLCLSHGGSPWRQGAVFFFPHRRRWSDPHYCGNCSGHIHHQIFEFLDLPVFTDPNGRRGTSVDITQEWTSRRIASICIRISRSCRIAFLTWGASRSIWYYRTRHVTTSSCTAETSGIGLPTVRQEAHGASSLIAASTE